MMTEEQRLKRNARARKHYQLNRAKALARMSVYKIKNEEALKEYSKAYMKDHIRDKAVYDNEYRKRKGL
tara:strand:- start:416 stop:622 length:207 start_codon:yes stop_codon:yes gene_type:complete